MASLSLSKAKIRRSVSFVKSKLTVLTIVAFLMLLATLGTAQTQGQLEDKYPKVNAYLVRPKILLTARYSTDGLVCEMVLQPVRWTGDAMLLFPLSEEETIRIVEEIVSESERGKKLDGEFSRVTGHS